MRPTRADRAGESRSGPSRLFFALWPDPMARQALAALVPGSPTRVLAEDLHLTVLFLGGVSEAQIPVLREIVAEIRLPAFEQTLAKLEVWPGPAILCAVGEPAPALVQLRESLQQATARAGIELTREIREFRAHVTLARHFAPARPSVAAVVAVSLQARQFWLVRSAPRADGRRYTPLASWLLR